MHVLVVVAVVIALFGLSMAEHDAGMEERTKNCDQDEDCPKNQFCKVARGVCEQHKCIPGLAKYLCPKGLRCNFYLFCVRW